MVKKGKIALLTGQADETYQKEFVTGAMRSAFKAGYDLCVFSMFIKYQSSREREIGDSNIYNLLGIASKTLQRNGMKEEAREMCEKIRQSGSYSEALCILGDYVNITSVDDEESEDEDYDDDYDMEEGEM